MSKMLSNREEGFVNRKNWKSITCFSLSYFLQVATAAIFIVSLYMLISNVSSGFDLTDGSVYVLWADQPENVHASTTLFGYYTHAIYLLTGKDIAAFRLLGLLILLSTGLLFAIMLERYWLQYSEADATLHVRLSMVVPVLCGILAYYHFWLLSPSYNWLVLVGILLVGASLLSAVTGVSNRLNKSNVVKKILFNSLLIGLGGGLAFMAKPTAAVLLGVLCILWVYSHREYEHKKLLLILSFFVSIIFFAFHALVYNGGFTEFINELKHAVELAGLIGAGHTISNLLYQSILDLLSLDEPLIKYSSFHILLASYVVVLILKWRNVQHEIISRLYILLIAAGLFLWMQLIYRGLGVFMGSGYAVLVITVYFILAAFVVYTQNQFHVEEGKPSFLRLLNLFFFLFILQSSYAFGSANGFLGQMSGATVFLGAASLYIIHWMEPDSKYKLFTRAASFLMVVSVYVILKPGYDRPYWLNVSIKEQVIPSTLLLNDSVLYVDSDMADYISELKEVALKGGWQPGTALIDLTGRSPGVTVILGGKFLAAPYLMGGYKGSSLFAQEMLALVPLAELKKAWVLTASGGIGTKLLSTKVLTNNGVNFPDNYTNVGKIPAGFIKNWQESEYQILWRPNAE